jgi:FkbH-like protein
VGDDGIEGIVIGQGSASGEAFVELQHAALRLHRRGVILAIASKNEEDTALSVFREHPEMVLKAEHIACHAINWESKPGNLRRIAEQLKIGLDSLVMVDDNPAERAAIRAALPMVAVPELPADPALVPGVLLAAGYFEATRLSREDIGRGQSYRELFASDRERTNHASEIDYLQSLGMVLTIRAFNPIDRSRITQLINKTNQFNLTTRRYTEPQVAAMEADPTLFTVAARLRDRLSDHGIISIAICRKVNDLWDIDTWLMSCRVLGRWVEAAILQVIGRSAVAAGAQCLVGHYTPTAKNALVRDHYSALGFTVAGADETKSSLWHVEPARAAAAGPVPMEIVFEETVAV